MLKTAANALIISLIFLHSIKTQDCNNLYVNNTAVTDTPTGSLASPFPDLVTAFAAISQNCSNNSVTVYVVTTSTPYTFENATNTGVVIDYSMVSVAIIGFFPNSLDSTSSCDLFPTIDLSGGDFLVNISSIQNISFSSINFIKAYSTSSPSNPNIQIQIDGSLSLQNICLTVSTTDQSEVSFITASSSQVTISSLSINGASPLIDTLLQIQSPAISFDTLNMFDLTLTQCNDPVIYITQCDNFEFTNTAATNLIFSCPFLDLESITSIQIQNFTAENVQLPNVPLILIDYNDDGESYSAELDSLNFTNFSQSVAAIYLSAGSNLPADSQPAFTLSNSQFSFFSVQLSTVLNSIVSSNSAIVNCNFTNNVGSVGNGTALSFGGLAVVINSGFTNNTSNGDVWDTYGCGGAIYGNSELNITNCAFTNNTSFGNGGGGAIYANDVAFVTNCLFTNNSAYCDRDGSGGAIMANSESLITNCVFMNNFAYGANGANGLGGAIFAYDLTEVTGCTFVNNSAYGVNGGTGFGGALTAYQESQISNCSFSNNSVSGDGGDGGGGAFAAIGQSSLESSTFTNNIAEGNGLGIGGGAVMSMSLLIVVNSLFASNIVTSETISLGGAINAQSELIVSGCAFTNNAISGGNTSQGGAIYAMQQSDIMNSAFDNNSVQGYGGSMGQGGALITLDATTITNCTFTNNFAYGLDGAGGSTYTNATLNASNCIFTNNSIGGVRTGRGGAVYTFQQASMMNCTFDNNSAIDAGGALFAFDNTTITNCTFTNNLGYGLNSAGGAVYANSTFSVVSCNFTNNSASGNASQVSGGGGAILAVAEFSLSNSTFYNNSANGQESNGGAISTFDLSNVTSCNFTNNNAIGNMGNLTSSTGAGGAISANAEITILGSNFTNNLATGFVENGLGGAIFVVAASYIINCTLTNNTAYDRGIGNGLGGAVYANLGPTIVSCNFTDNVAINGKGGAIITVQEMSVTNCTFENDTADLGGAIYASTGTNISGCLFDSCVANKDGSAVFTAYLNMTNSTLSNNNAGGNGGAIAVIGGANISECDFNNNIADGVYGGGAIYFGLVGLSIIVDSCNFTNNHAVVSYGGAIYSIAEMNIINCIFTSNNVVFDTGDYTGGGAIYLTAETNISNCLFEDNTAVAGAAIYATATSNIIATDFFDNNAGAGGGAVYSTAELNITNSTFVNNTVADGGGSAIAYVPGDTDICDISNEYANTILAANTFSNNISPFPFIFNDQIYNSCNETASSINPQPTLLINVTSGDSGVVVSGCNLNNASWSATSPISQISWAISVVTNSLDCWFQPLSDNDPDKSIQINFLDNNTLTSSLSNCSSALASCTISNPLSSLAFNETLITIPYSFTYQSSNYYVNSPVFNVLLRNCGIGQIFEFTNGVPTCLACPRGTYSLSYYALTCLPCPANASYCSNGNINLKNDTWRSSIYSANIIPCRVDGICFDGNLTGTCYPGYTGPLCQACDHANGYARASGADKCAECSSSVFETFLIASVIFIASVGYLMLYSNMILNATKDILSDTHREQMENELASSIYIRLLVTYSQIVVIVDTSIDSFSAIGIEYVENLFGYTGNPAGSLLFSNVCMLLKSDLVSTSNIFHFDIALTTCLPFVFIISIAVICICKWRSLNRSNFYRLANMANCILIMSQPSVVQKLLNFLQCAPLPISNINVTEPDPTYYIQSELGYQCYSDSYYSFLFTFVVPGLIIWVVVLPVMQFYVLYKNRHNLDEHRIRITMGVLLNGYKPQAYYWALIDMILKISLIGISTLLFSDPKTNALTICFVLYVYFELFKRIQPYNQEKPGKIEQFSLFSYILTIQTVLYIKSNSYEMLMIVGIIAVVAVNVGIVYTLISNLMSANKQKIKSYLEIVKKLSKSRRREHGEESSRNAALELNGVGQNSLNSELDIVL